MSTRTLINLPDDDKAWLDGQAVERGQPMTLLVREAVAEYRLRAHLRTRTQGGETLAELLDGTAGLFARGRRSPEDGLAKQRRLRAEWRPAGAAAARKAKATPPR